MKGVTVAICCYNSASRIQKVLEHLQAQKIDRPIDWEVVLIDNASNDDLLTASLETLGRNLVFSFKVVSEPRLGLSFARMKAFEVAKYDIIALVDDDNWVNANWVQNVYEVFETNPEVTAAAGPLSARCEVSPPAWFDEVRGHYSIWEPYAHARFINEPLRGAGMCIRKKAINELFKRGFSFLLTDRQGSKLSSGGDFELSFMFLLTGGKLWYDPLLLIEHFIPKSRLSWSYVKRLNYGFGMQSVYLELYENSYKKASDNGMCFFEWLKKIVPCIFSLIRFSPKKLWHVIFATEGDAQELIWHNLAGRIQVLFKERAILQKRKNLLNEIL